MGWQCTLGACAYNQHMADCPGSQQVGEEQAEAPKEGEQGCRYGLLYDREGAPAGGWALGHVGQ